MNDAQLGPLVRHVRRLVEAQATKDLSDAQLLDRFVNDRDEAAFAALMRRHGGLVWLVCRQVLHQEQDAEDAFQASFLVLALKAASLRREHGLGNWLYSVAYRVAMNAKRKAIRRKTHESRKAAATPPAQPTDDALHELQSLLHEEINHLQVKYRLPLVLCGLEGKSRSEAAKELGWKEGTVSGRLARARKMLQERLARRGVALAAAWTATTLSAETGAAVIPSALARATIDGALYLAAGKVLTAGVVSSQAISLMKGTVKALLLAKLKLTVTFVLGLGLFGIGAGMAAYEAFTHYPSQFSGESEASASDEIPAPQAKQSRVDLYGDSLPEGIIARLGTVRFRQDDVEAMALSPDGRVLITHSRSGGSICAWQADSGKSLWRIKHGWMTSATFSPDGRFLAEVFDCRYENRSEEFSRIYLRDSKDGKLLHRFPKEGGFPFTIWDAIFSPDSKIIAASDRGTIYLWSTETGRQLVKWASPIPADAVIRFSPDGKTLITASGGTTIGRWDVTKCVKTSTIELKPKETYWHQAMSEDGRLLAVSAGLTGPVPAFGPVRTATLQLFDTTTGKERCKFEGDTTGIEELVLSRDGSTLIGVSSATEQHLHTISDWDTRTGKLRHRFPIRLKHCWRLGVTPDGAKLYTSATYNHGWLAHGPDESLVRWWDVATGKEVMTKPAHENRVNSVCFTPDGRFLLSAANDESVRVWDIASGRSLRQISNENHYGTALSIVSSRGTFLSGGWGDKLRLYDWITGRRLQSFAAPPESDDVPDFMKSAGSVRSFVVSPDGESATFLLTRSSISGRTEQSFHQWDLAARKIRSSSAMSRNIEFSHFLPDGKKFIGIARQSKEVVLIVDIETGRTEAALRHSDRESMRMATTADGRILVTATSHDKKWDGEWVGIGPHTIHVWELTSGKECMTITLKESGADDRCDLLAIAPDCRTLVTVSHGDTVRFWDMATGAELLRRTSPAASVTSLAFSPDAKVLATGHADSTILLWDLASIGARYKSLLMKTDAQQLAASWEDLASSDARKAHRAIGRLIAAGDSATALLRIKLAPAPEAGGRIAGLIDDLDHDSFVRREKASKELEKLLPQARPALLEVLAKKPPLEVRLRIESLLARSTMLVHDAQSLREIRSVQVLEGIATGAARDLLRNLAAGDRFARLTQEAKAAVERLEKKDTVKP
jgi:RNA polymerase sigma factor (sigma-70 family)